MFLIHHTTHTLRSFDNTLLYYEKTGKEEIVPSLLFLHGMGGDLTAWNKERQELVQKGYSSIAVDLRGHGLSGRPEDIHQYELSNFVKDISLLIKKEFKSPPIIIGHCFGGMIGILLASTHQQIAQGLVLVDTGYKPPFMSSFGLDNIFIKGFVKLLLPILPSAHLKGHINFDDFVDTHDFDPLRIANDMMHVSLKSYFMIIHNLQKYDALTILSRIKIPTLVVQGTHDLIFPVPVGRKIHKRIAHSELQLIEGGNHIVVLNNPKQLTDSIAFFAGKTAKNPSRV